MKTRIRILVLLSSILLARAEGNSRDRGAEAAQDSLVQRASRLYVEGNYAEALALKDPIDSLAASPKLLFYRGMSHAALYDYPSALECLRKAATGDSANVSYRFQYGKLLVQAGFTEDAVGEFTKCIALDSTYLPASFQLGLLYNAQKNNPAKEEAIFSFLIRQNPNDFVSLYYKGDALKRLDQADSGMIFIERSIALNPQYYPSLVALAHYLDANKKYAAALEYYRRAEGIRPHDKDLLFQTGECLRKLKSLNEAVAYFKKALAIDSTSDIYHAQLGYAYYSLGRFDSSIMAYNTAIAIDGDNAQYYHNCALAYGKIDSVQAAARYYKKEIEALHPDNISAANLNLASFYFSKGLKREAVDVHLENISYGYNNLAVFYFSRNMSREAANAYQRVYELHPSNIEALHWLAVSLSEIPDRKGAMQAYEKILALTEGDSSKTMQHRAAKIGIEYLKKSAR